MNTGMHLMQALCAAIRRKQVDWDRPLAEEEWKELFRLAQEQHVLPIVVESIYGSNAFQSQPDSWRQQVIQKSIRITMGQTVRTSAFLELFEKMQQAGLHPLVMKGLACRVLYPSPDSRPSSDEDLLVSPEEFSQAADFLKTQGFETTEKNVDIDREFEIGFIRRDGLYLELHKSPFSPQSSALGEFNAFFTEATDEARCLTVEGKEISVMAPHDHMLYMLLHAYKHLIYSGFGVRQVCDIILWAEQYGTEIDWKLLKRQCEQVRAWKFTLCLFGIAQEYLEFRPEKAAIPLEFLEEEVPYQDLLMDLLEGGVYGGKDQTRKHSSTVTLRTVESEREGRSYTILQTLFPEHKELAGRYSYLKRYPILLPVAWGQRLLGYGKEVLQGGRIDDGAQSLEIGKQRVELLRKLDIIE